MKLHVYFPKNDGTRMQIFRGHSVKYLDGVLMVCDKEDKVKYIIPSFLYCEYVNE